MSSGADPLVCAGRPRPAVLSKDQASAQPNWAGQGPAADEASAPQGITLQRKYQQCMPRRDRDILFAIVHVRDGVGVDPAASARLEPPQQFAFGRIKCEER